MSNKIILLLLLIVIGVVFYFSWLSDPGLMSETYLPMWLLNWSNRYYNLRTAVPFVAFGFLLECYTEYKSPNEEVQNKGLIFMQNTGIALIVVCIAEGGQFMIQRRSPDLMDVFYGITGSIMGALVYNLSKRLKNAK